MEFLEESMIGRRELRILLIGCLTLVSVSFAKCQHSPQNSAENKRNLINLLDEKGLKQGVWKDTIGSLISTHHYVNDTLHGSIMKYAIKTNTLQVEGVYEKGQRVGEWNYYDRSSGNLLYQESQIARNTEITVQNEGNPYMPPMMSYVKSYDRNKGYLSWEGMILYTDSFEEDTYVPHGEWLYYDEQGNVIKREKYQAGLLEP